jgi:copper resistance protein C
MNRIHRWMFAGALFLAGCLQAKAHAYLDHAVPAVGGTVREAPARVEVWFTRSLDPDASTIQVFDAANKEVDGRDARVDDSDATLISVSLPKLAPGTYEVVWKAVCRDTHVTQGSFTFEVAGP